jgi:hypothetical protein
VKSSFGICARRACLAGVSAGTARKPAGADDSRSRKRYLPADPERCRCLYVGDDADFQRYTDLELRQEEKSSVAAQKRDDRLAGVNDVTPDITGFEMDIETQE